MELKFIASKRDLKGSSASRRLRKTGKTPGIVYGSKKQPVLIELDHNNLYHALLKEEFHSSILDIEIDGQMEKVLLRDFQMHPYKKLVRHVDFQRVETDVIINIKVPLHFSGEEISPAVKTGGGLVSHVQNEIELRCLPADLPQFIAVDLSKLESGQSIHAKDLKLPDNVTLSPSYENDNPVLVIVASMGKDDEVSE